MHCGGAAEGAHLDTITRNFLPLPATNEWGEGWGEGHSIIVASSPPPSPPLGEERERTSTSRMVVVSRCAPTAPSSFFNLARGRWMWNVEPAVKTVSLICLFAAIQFIFVSGSDAQS